MADRSSEPPVVDDGDGACIVSLHGDVDMEMAPAVRKLLLDCVAGGKAVLVDMSGVAYIDSSGIASLIEALQTSLGNGNAFGLISVSEQARRVLELARLDKVFAIHPDRDSALAALG
jgi:anti-sigma B factor antagonist